MKVKRGRRMVVCGVVKVRRYGGGEVEVMKAEAWMGGRRVLCGNLLYVGCVICMVYGDNVLPWW